MAAIQIPAKSRRLAVPARARSESCRAETTGRGSPRRPSTARVWPPRPTLGPSSSRRPPRTSRAALGTWPSLRASLSGQPLALEWEADPGAVRHKCRRMPANRPRPRLAPSKSLSVIAPAARSRASLNATRSATTVQRVRVTSLMHKQNTTGLPAGGDSVGACQFGIDRPQCLVRRRLTTPSSSVAGVRRARRRSGGSWYARAFASAVPLQADRGALGVHLEPVRPLVPALVQGVQSLGVCHLTPPRRSRGS